MSIKQAVAMFSIFIVIGIMGLLVVASRLMMVNSEESEQQQMKSEMLRARDRLQQQLVDFGTFVGDWAAWDDPYDFVTHLDKQFIEDNLSSESMRSANVSMIVFLDATGTIVFSKAIDQNHLTEVNLPEPLARLLVEQHDAFVFTKSEEFRSGIVMDGDVVMMLAAYPLIGSSRVRPINGTLVMGRQYVSTAIDLGEKRLLTNSLTSLDKELPTMSNLLRDRVKTGEVTLEVEEGDLIAAYQTIVDIRNKPSILVRVEQPRTLVMQAQKVQLSYGILLLVLTVVFGALLVVVSERVVSRPLDSLRKELAGLVSLHDFGKRVTVSGLKEHKEVSESINQLMEMNQRLAEATWAGTKKMKEQLVQIEAKNDDMEKTKLAIMNILEDERELEEQLRLEKTTIEETVAARTRELVEEQAKLEGSIDSLPVGYLMIDKEGNAVMVNKAMRKLLPTMDMSGMVTQVVDWLKTDGEVSAKEVERLPAAAVIKKGVAFNNGYVDLSVVPIQVTDDLKNSEERIGWVALLSDVTEAKNLQKSRDEFFSIASHELRTPLTAIRGNTALIRDYYPDIMKDESVHQIIDDIHGASIRLISIVNDFLDASRLELKKIEFKIEPFDMAAMVKKVTEAIAPTAKEKQIGWELRLGEIQTLSVSGDVARTEQVLYNLMGNAIKFTKEGGVVVELKHVGEMAEVWVTDSGLGISPENQRLLFKKFQQAGESVFTREASQGSGMGLYISKLLVEGMGGVIRLETSELGKGSTFVLGLPVMA